MKIPGIPGQVVSKAFPVILLVMLALQKIWNGWTWRSDAPVVPFQDGGNSQ